MAGWNKLKRLQHVCNCYAGHMLALDSSKEGVLRNQMKLCQPADVVKQLGPEYHNRREGGVQEVCGCLGVWWVGASLTVVVPRAGKLNY